MSFQDQAPKSEKEPLDPELTSQEEQDKDPQDTDELSEESLDEASGGLIETWNMTSGTGQYPWWQPKKY